MEHSLGDAPIEEKYYEVMNRLGKFLDHILNDLTKGGTRKTGFVLLVFDFDDDSGRMNYISNANRSDVVTALKEQVARFEGRMTGDEGNA
jgi:hypothetical protein